MNAKIISLLILSILVLNSCVKAPVYSNIPNLEFVSLSQDTLVQNAKESVYITFSVTDGDNDISGLDNDVNVFLMDTRSNFVEKTYKVPFIPNLGTGNGIKGEIKLSVESSCCSISPLNPCGSTVGYDKMRYKIYLKDQAGHYSDTITTSEIVLNCHY